jgi:hypothetical protein
MKREKEILHETMGKLVKKNAFCKSEMAEMEQNSGTKDGQIINLKVKKWAKQSSIPPSLVLASSIQKYAGAGGTSSVNVIFY